MDKEKSKEQLLDYCHKLYQRENASLQKSGLTKWALLVALTYILWNTIPLLDLLKHDLALKKHTLILFTHMLLSSICVLEFLSSTGKVVSKFDIRLNRIESKDTKFFHLLFIFLFFSVLPILSRSMIQETNFQSLTLSATGFFSD